MEVDFLVFFSIWFFASIVLGFVPSRIGNLP
jgi:hypothetical protein